MANMLNTITVDGLVQDAAEYAELHKVVKKNDDLDKDAFLQLLVAQMKYQDPLDPQDNSEFVAELAQFSALEQMTNVANNLDKLSGIVDGMSSSVNIRQLSSMIGMQVDWTVDSGEVDEDGEPITTSLTGLITGVNVDDEEPTVSVSVGNATYNLALANIDRIYDAANDSATDNRRATFNSTSRSPVGTPNSSPVGGGLSATDNNRSTRSRTATDNDGATTAICRSTSLGNGLCSLLHGLQILQVDELIGQLGVLGVEGTVETGYEEHEDLRAHTDEQHQVSTRDVRQLEERTEDNDGSTPAVGVVHECLARHGIHPVL